MSFSVVLSLLYAVLAIVFVLLGSTVVAWIFVSFATFWLGVDEIVKAIDRVRSTR